MKIIPAIDIIEGKCVRLTEGKFESVKVYSADPLQVAMEFEQASLTDLHLVDLDGAKSGQTVNLKILERIANNTSLDIDFSGGIKHEADVSRALSMGASKVACGSIAVQNSELFLKWVEKFGPEKIMLSADVKDSKIAIRGWTESSQYGLLFFLKQYSQLGIRNVICTDIANDGALLGPNFDLYNEVLQAVPAINLIASGGVSNIDDIIKLDNLGLHGVIVGKAIYENRITLSQLSELAHAN